MKAKLECGGPDERKREGPKRTQTAQVLRMVYVRRVVEREGVIKCLTVRYLISPGAGGDCRNAAVHAAAFSHFRHIEPSSGWFGHRRGEETAPCMAVRIGEAICRPGRFGLSRPLRRCTGLWRKPLDQEWRGRNSVWVEGVGCDEVVTECISEPKA